SPRRSCAASTGCRPPVAGSPAPAPSGPSLPSTCAAVVVDGGRAANGICDYRDFYSETVEDPDGRPVLDDCSEQAFLIGFHASQTPQVRGAKRLGQPDGAGRGSFTRRQKGRTIPVLSAAP